MTLPTEQSTDLDLRPGTAVIFHGYGDRRIALVDAVDVEMGTVTVSTVNPHTGEITTYTAAADQLAAPPGELDGESWALVQRITEQAAARAHQRYTELADMGERWRQRLAQANNTIASMRRYAINKHLDGTICREGLNDFLRAHDLEEYVSRHTAEVTVTARVEVDNADTEYAVQNLIQRRLELTSGDEDLSVLHMDSPEVGQIQRLAEDDAADALP